MLSPFDHKDTVIHVEVWNHFIIGRDKLMVQIPHPSSNLTGLRRHSFIFTWRPSHSSRQRWRNSHLSPARRDSCWSRHRQRRQSRARYRSQHRVSRFTELMKAKDSDIVYAAWVELVDEGKPKPYVLVISKQSLYLSNVKKVCVISTSFQRIFSLG